MRRQKQIFPGLRHPLTGMPRDVRGQAAPTPSAGCPSRFNLHVPFEHWVRDRRSSARAYEIPSHDSSTDFAGFCGVHDDSLHESERSRAG